MVGGTFSVKREDNVIIRKPDQNISKQSSGIGIIIVFGGQYGIIRSR